MKLYECVVLLILVLNTGATYREEIDTILQILENRASSNKNQKDFSSVSKFSPKTKYDTKGKVTYTDSSSLKSKTNAPVGIAIFNAGNYSVQLKLNYTLSNQEIKYELNSDIKKGQYRSIFIPKTATFVHIRVKQTGTFKKQIINERIADLKYSKGFCYLLAHTGSYPVYGICPSTYQAMVETWGPNNP